MQILFLYQQFWIKTGVKTLAETCFCRDHLNWCWQKLANPVWWWYKHKTSWPPIVLRAMLSPSPSSVLTHYSKLCISPGLWPSVWLSCRSLELHCLASLYVCSLHTCQLFWAVNWMAGNLYAVSRPVLGLTLLWLPSFCSVWRTFSLTYIPAISQQCTEGTLLPLGQSTTDVPIISAGWTTVWHRSRCIISTGDPWVVQSESQPGS